jgi:hypothetical protein
MSDALIRITALAESLTAAVNHVDSLTAQLEVAKANQLRIEREDLPELMREFSITQIKLANGASVEVIDDLTCAITEFNRPKAHEWLEVHGFSGLIKTLITVAFGREEKALATKTLALLQDQIDAPAELKENIHPATLKSFVKERREAGQSVPEDLFGVFVYSKAKITMPKVKKVK